MKLLALTACALMGLMASCASVAPEKAKPSVTTGAQDVLPKAFSVSIGGFFGPSYKVTQEGNQLVYQTYGGGWHLEKTKRITPSAEDWQAFWKEADSVALWNWKPLYQPKIVHPDGTSWDIDLTYGGRHIHSEGLNGYPGNRDHKKTITDDDGPMVRFNQFTSAVSKLIGGRDFR